LTTDTPDFRKILDAPNFHGAAEYLAVYELITEAELDEGEEAYNLAVDICDEFITHATAIKARIQAADPRRAAVDLPSPEPDPAAGEDYALAAPSAAAARFTATTLAIGPYGAMLEMLESMRKNPRPPHQR
jgi:hypothetical protein